MGGGEFQTHYPILRNSILDMDIRRNDITVVNFSFNTNTIDANLFETFDMSFTYKINNKGPRIDP